jgi:DNA-binding NarL/FixJ family response regulator
MQVQTPPSAGKMAAMGNLIEEPMAIRVALVEDDQELRASVASLLKRAAGLQVVATCGSAEEALAELVTHQPDVVLMDINLPGADGVECVRRLKLLLPQVQVLMLTMYEDNERLFNSILAGADGYLLKRTVPTQLVQAVREVKAGGAPMTPQIARRVFQHFRQVESPAPAQHEVENLTRREKEVLEHLVRGNQFKQIADALGLSIDGVRFHVRRIYEKLHVHSRTDAVVKYLKR